MPFFSLAGERYDCETLTERVLKSQRWRNFLETVVRKQSVDWSYQLIEKPEEFKGRNAKIIYGFEKKSKWLQVWRPNRCLDPSATLRMT